MQKTITVSRYPRINTRIPIDLHIQLGKVFSKRGELSKAIVLILREAIGDKDKISEIKARISNLKEKNLKEDPDLPPKVECENVRENRTS